MIVILFLIGLIIGSFLGMLTWRIPKGVLLKNSRSVCDNCKHKIDWYDNIPLFSYILLLGKCRHCQKRISLRYPVIELTTASLFVAVYLLQNNIAVNFSFLNLYLSLVLASFFIALFIIDFEHQILPDSLIFSALLIIIFQMLYSNYPFFYQHLLSGLISSLFFLALHFGTAGKGMGLGDVKLALLLGIILGPTLTLVSVFVAFIIGGLFATILLVSKQAKFGQKIAFGPFLITGFFVASVYGHQILKLAYPI